MRAEIILRFDAGPPDEFGHREPAIPDYAEILEGIRSVTELSNEAEKIRRETGACVVNFNWIGDENGE